MRTQNRTAAILVAVCILTMISTVSVRSETKTLEIDPVHSSVLFRIKHLYTMFTGRFNVFSGTIVGDPEDPASLWVTAQVSIAGIDTANKARETHLLAPDFFDAKRFQLARFKSTKTVPGKDNTARVTGDLTIRDTTREVTFDVKLLGHGPDHRKGRRAGFHAEVTINRKDFGVSYGGKLPNGLVVLGDEVELILEIEAVEVQPKEAAPAAATSLADQLDALKSSRRPAPQTDAVLARAEKEIKAAGGIDGLKIGERAPDFALPDTAGTPFALSGALAKGPVIVVFFRGEWCPYCNLQMRALEKVYPQIRKLGASLLAITPQKQDKSQAQETRKALSFPLLSDTTGDVMRRYRLLYTIPPAMREVYLKKYGLDLEKYNGEGRWELPVTATYIIGRDGAVKAGVTDFDYTKRMEPEDILAALKALQK